MQLLREGGCGGVLPPAGRSLTDAAERSGYQAEAAAGLHIRGPGPATVQLLKQAGCRIVTSQAMHDIGVYQRGSDTWLVLASANVTPAISQAPILATRALQLINEVRARGARCGERSFAPAPADRVRAVGYQEKLVGENIAYGPKSADEVVQGWLDSPGHCENIMDPRFAEMGIAYAAGQSSRRGLFWVQLLVAPKA